MCKQISDLTSEVGSSARIVEFESFRLDDLVRCRVETGGRYPRVFVSFSESSSEDCLEEDTMKSVEQSVAFNEGSSGVLTVTGAELLDDRGGVKGDLTT